MKKAQYKVKHDWAGDGGPAPKLSANGKRIGRPPKKRYSTNWGGKREGSGRKAKPETTSLCFRVPVEIKEKTAALQERGFKPRDIYISAIRDLCKTLGI